MIACIGPADSIGWIVEELVENSNACPDGALETARQPLVQKHDAATAIGIDEQYAGGFKRTPNLVVRVLMHREPTFGLQALQRGQRHEGFLCEHFLLPVQQRSRGPNLSAGDHS